MNPVTTVFLSLAAVMLLPLVIRSVPPAVAMAALAAMILFTLWKIFRA